MKSELLKRKKAREEAEKRLTLDQLEHLTIEKSIGVGTAHWVAPLLPPNRTCSSPAYGSPVDDYLQPLNEDWQLPPRL